MIKKLPLTYVGHVVCSNVTSNIEVVRQFVQFYKTDIYYKGRHNSLPVEMLQEINELIILSSTALSETTEMEATRLIVRFINFFSYFAPECCSFEELPETNENGNPIFVYGFFSISRIERLSTPQLKEYAMTEFLAEQEKLKGSGHAVSALLVFAVEATFMGDCYFEIAKPVLAKLLAIREWEKTNVKNS